MFEAIERGEIKALWVMATNPAVSLPRAGAVREALRQARAVRRVRERALATTRVRPARTCCFPPRPGARRTARSPIPSGASRASARFLPLPGEAQPDWWIVAEVARRMGYGGAFAYRSAPPTCSASMRRCRRSRMTARAMFDIGGARGDFGRGLRRARAGAMAGARGAAADIPRLFADGDFFTPDRKARFVAPERPALRERDQRRISAACSTPAACATSGTP